MWLRLVSIYLLEPSEKQDDTGLFFFQKKYYPWSIYSCVWCLFDRRLILAPTSSDLVKCGQKGTILAKFLDINFLTIHGRSRYPSLDIWARNTGQRIGVEILPGHNFLVQAWTYQTGGLISKLGFMNWSSTIKLLKSVILMLISFCALISRSWSGYWTTEGEIPRSTSYPNLIICPKKMIWLHHCVKS